MIAVAGTGSACSTTAARNRRPAPVARARGIAGVWEGMSRSLVSEGMGTGDTRIERQAWRLTQNEGTIAGYYVLELTMISGDGRPYLCSREPRFSTLLRFEVRGHIDAVKGAIELDEVGDVK